MIWMFKFVNFDSKVCLIIVSSFPPNIPILMSLFNCVNNSGSKSLPVTLFTFVFEALPAAIAIGQPSIKERSAVE